MKRSQLESMDLGPLRTTQAILLAILPSWLKTRIYRLFGAKIGKGVSIGFGSFILADSFSQISIGDYSKIRQFTLVVCSNVYIGHYSEIAMFVWIWGAGKLRVGNKCYIGPRCIINLRRNDFEMGSYAGLGPGSTVYTHGQWLPYTQGWPRTYGDVVMEDFAWVPAKVLLMPGVRIGTKSIIGSGAVVTKDIPPNSFAVGVPAKVINSVQNIIDRVDEQELLRRIVIMAKDIPDFFRFRIVSEESNGGIFTIIIVAYGNQWRIVASKPQDIQNLELTNSPPRTLLLLTGPVPENLKQTANLIWFDLANLRCMNITTRFAFDIWDFLRRTWCVTCDISDNQC